VGYGVEEAPALGAPGCRGLNRVGLFWLTAEAEHAGETSHYGVDQQGDQQRPARLGNTLGSLLGSFTGFHLGLSAQFLELDVGPLFRSARSG